MFFAWTLFSLFLTLVDASQLPNQLPDFITPCFGDPKLVKCPAQLLERLRHRLVQGISELQLPPIDPLIVPYVRLTRRGTAIADYTANVTDVAWTGAAGFKILETFIDIDDLIFRIKLSFPYLLGTGNVYAKGRLLSFDMGGAGDFSSKATNVVFDIVLNGELYDHDGLDYVIWKQEDVEMNFDEFEFVHLHGLFDDPALSHLFRLALNRGWRLVGMTTKQFVVKSIGTFIVDAINRVHSLYAREVLYPNL